MRHSTTIARKSGKRLTLRHFRRPDLRDFSALQAANQFDRLLSGNQRANIEESLRTILAGRGIE